MIKLEHDRKSLWQWDINQRVIIEDIEPGTLVHFESVPVTPYEENGMTYADIPNDLLQKSYLMNVYAYVFSGDDGYTKENAIFNINKREKPEDYDANVMFSDTVDEILGEVVNGGLGDKLAYLKSCLDIIYQSPPIKLMREAYGNNTKFKDFCKNIVQSYKNNYAVIGHGIEHSSSVYNSGFSDGSPGYRHPNGMPGVINKGFICPEVYFIPGNTKEVKFTISAYNNDGNTKTLTNLDILDFRNVVFPVDESTELFELFLNMFESGNGFGFNAECTRVDGVYLPKFSSMDSYRFIDCSDSYPSISQGLHLGQIFMCNTPRWLFRYKDNVSPSLCGVTPVYCDKNFIGDVYLEKLNIDINCFVDLFNNLAPLTGEAYYPDYGYFEYDFSPMIFSIGNYNIKKIKTEVSGGNKELEQALNNATAKGWDIQ